MAKASIAIQNEFAHHKSQIDMHLHRMDATAAALYNVGLTKPSEEIRTEIFNIRRNLRKLGIEINGKSQIRDRNFQP